MVRFLTAAALTLAAWPAWAMCNDTYRPPVRVCLDGVCENTVTVEECSYSPDGSAYSWENGLGVSFPVGGGEMLVYRGDTEIPYTTLTCTPLDVGGCPPPITR